MKGYKFIESITTTQSKTEFSIWQSNDAKMFCLCKGKSHNNKCFDPEPRIIIQTSNYNDCKNLLDNMSDVL